MPSSTSPGDTEVSGPVRLSISMLPANEEVSFKDTSLFSRHGEQAAIPPPAEVWERALNFGNPDRVTIAEGQCLWAIRKLLHGQIPVPEVYGWCKDDNDVFIYMELVHGVTLEERWESLSGEERIEISEQLRSSSKST
ncbi:hypothetical protein RUND412_005572 [Rhizina undulata]